MSEMLTLIDCITFPQIKLGRYIKFKESYSKGFVLLEIIGRPTVVQAAFASLLNGRRLEFDFENWRESEIVKQKLDVIQSNRQTTANGLTVITIVNKAVMKDLFTITDGKPDKKFVEVLRRKVEIPIAEEWAADLFNLLSESSCIEKISSNIGTFGTIENGNDKVKEVVEDYINLLPVDAEIADCEIPRTIGAFVDAFSKPLTDMIYEKCNVIYKGEREDKIDYNLITNNGFIPYPQQADIANAVVKRFQTDSTVFIGAEMGCGKTLMSLMALYGLYKKTGKGQRALLMVPPHLVEKWIREARKAYGETVLQNVKVISNKKDCDDLRSLIGTKPKGIELYVVSREMAKLGYYWRPVAVKYKEPKTSKLIVECPACGNEQVINKSAKSFCKHTDKNGKVCGEALWQAVETKGARQIHRIPVMEYMKKYLPGGFFDLFILDEAHEEKGESARGIAAAQAACVSKKSLLLTGTLSGGKPSTLFYLLWRFSPNSMKDISTYGDTIGFARRFGVVETVRKSDATEDNRMSRASKQRVIVKEKPGISPELLTKFLPCTAFMKISDVASGLPEYTEYVTQVELGEEHKKAYSALEVNMLNAFSFAIRMGAIGVLAKMLTILTAYADNPVYEEVCDKEGNVIATASPIEGITAKEEMLAQIIGENKAKGRKTLVFCEFTNIRDIQQRLKETLESFDISSAILPASIAPVKREEWIKNNTADKDVLICNPRLVATGLDLYQYPTIVFYQTPYSTYLLRQASRRSWRIGQTEPVEVHFLINSGTVQEKAMLLIANKMTAAQIFEGEIPEEDGLAALSDIEEKSFVRELAESLSKNESNSGSLDKLWKQKISASVKADDLLFAPQVAETEPKKTATVTETVKTEIRSNRGFTEKFVFQKISPVILYPDKTASFTVENQMYLMKDGKVYEVSGKPDDMSKKFAGRYVWEKSKKTGNKFAKCSFKGQIVYVGKKADTGEFVALKIVKAEVAA